MVDLVIQRHLSVQAQTHRMPQSSSEDLSVVEYALNCAVSTFIARRTGLVQSWQSQVYEAVSQNRLRRETLPLTLWTNYEAATVWKSKEKSEFLVAVK